MTATDAVLVLEDGRTFRGEAYGAIGSTFGEAVFATGMTGYQETLTDPSYRGQVVVMTAPHIGNTGVNDEDPESSRIWVNGYVVRDPARRVSNWRAVRSLDDDLAAQGIVGISGIDTRALTRHLRERGAMRVGIFSGEAAGQDSGTLLAQVLESPEMKGANLVGDVTTAETYVVPAIGERRFRVAAVDLGIKSMTPHRMAERGIETHVVPAGISLPQILALEPDGVFFSNGPGDPAAAGYAVEAMLGVLAAGTPVFGICLGSQILGRALGLGTYKLRFGHRGVNQPVKDLATGKVQITSHNHGFAVAPPGAQTLPAGADAPQASPGTDGPLRGPGRAAFVSHDQELPAPFDTPFGRAQVSHVNLNDGVVEGIRLLDAPAFSVQYHPEAAPGPHDASGEFAAFCALMEGARHAPA